MVAHAKPTPVCPFCKGPVLPELARAGGNCPHCMLEIPGEEAATDPGLEMRKKQEAEAAQVAKGKRLRSVVVSALLGVLLVASGGLYYWQRQLAEDDLVYDIDEPYVPDAERGAERPAAVAEAPAPHAGGAARPPRAGRPASPAAEGLPAAAVEGSGSPAVKPVVKYVPSAPAGDLAVTAAQGGSGGVALGGVDIGVARVTSDVIKDDEQIFAMAKEVIGAYSPQVENCVQQKLRNDDTFNANFRVAFTIVPEGTVKKVKVEPLGQSDADVEACISRVVGAWTFAKIAREFPVKKSFRYSAGY